MTFVVPFDGSSLAEAALVRASEFGDVLDERVVAAVVIPEGNAEYARERGWLDDDESYDTKTIASRLHEQVTGLVPEADFRHVVVDTYAPSGTIAKRICTVAEQEDASMVFVGSENAGHVVTSVSSVGDAISNRAEYDVVIVRNRAPSKIAQIRNASRHGEPKSDFYLPE
jgi:nucleotide-binding universal stress UspA family protein